MAIGFHDTLSGFLVVWGVGTASLEAKLIQQLMKIRVAFLNKIFLDLQKSYDVLYRDQCLGILESYDVGPQVDRDPPDVMGPAHHGRKVQRISYPPFQVIPWGGTG